MGVTIRDIQKMLDVRTNILPDDDFRIRDTWAEYSKNKNLLQYLCFEFETVNPETGEQTKAYKAVKLMRIIKLPKEAKQSLSLMEMQEQVLTSCYEIGINFITLIANVIQPALGTLYFYGCQGVASNIYEAKEEADRACEGLKASLQGTYKTLHFRFANKQEAEWLREKMRTMDALTVIKGIPKPNRLPASSGTSGIGDKNIAPTAHETMEEIIAGMLEHEYVLQVLSTPVFNDTLQGLVNQTQAQMTYWYDHLQGSTSLNFNISLPMMMSSNASSSQGWQNNYSNAESVNYTESENFSVGASENTGVSFNEGYGLSYGQGTSQNVSEGVTVNNSYSQGLTVGEGTSVNQGVSLGQALGQSLSHNESSSLNIGHGVSEGINEGYSHGTGLSNTQSLNQSLGWNSSTTNTESLSQNYNYNVTQNQAVSNTFAQSQQASASDTVNANTNSAVNLGNSLGNALTNSSTLNFNDGNSSGNNTGHSGTLNGSESHSASGGGNLGFQGIVGVNGTVSDGTNIGAGYNVSAGQNLGETGGVGYGNNIGYSNSQSANTGISNSYGVGIGETLTQGVGSSQSVGVNQGIAFGESFGLGTSNSQSVSNGNSLNIGIGSSQALSYNDTVSLGANKGWNESVSYGNASGMAIGQTQTENISQNYSTGYSQNISQSQTVSQGTAQSVTVGNGYSQNQTQSINQSVGSSQGSGSSISQGVGSSQGTGTTTSHGGGTSGGFSLGQGMSMGLSPSIGYSRNHQWVDQGVKDIIQMLEFKNERYKRSLRGSGAFYTYVYLACKKKSLSAAMAVAKSAWQNVDALVEPLQVMALTRQEQEHLLYHFNAFSGDVTREDCFGLSQAKYSSLLLPEEYTAYTHLPRITVGGVFSDIEDIPIFNIYADMKGEIYMGTQLSTAVHGFDTQYASPHSYNLDESRLMHTLFVGGSRCGKTVAAMRFVAELAHVVRKKTEKRMRIVIMDQKKDWRGIARYVEPERFNFYSMSSTTFHPIKLNVFKIPKNVEPQRWIDGIIDIWCRAYGLLVRGKLIVSKPIYELYKEAGVFEAFEQDNWRETVPELSSKVTFPRVYERLKQMQNSPTEQADGKKVYMSGDTREAYDKILDRLEVFSRPYSVEARLYGSEDGLGIDELVGEDDVTVFEADGLEETFSHFIFGCITSGFYKIAKTLENGFLNEDQYETLLVIEEANAVLSSNKTGAGANSTASDAYGESEFDKMTDQAAGLGLFVMAITQDISQMPSSLLLNSSLLFVFRQTDEKCKQIVLTKMGKEYRLDDRAEYKFLSKMPVGWCICHSTRGTDILDAEAVLVHIAMLNNAALSNKDLDEMFVLKKTREIIAKNND